jgi:DNA polymerase I-like protein with 3'-5' exonuclease and polymerase domains
VAEYLAELREVTEGGGWGQSRDFVARQLHSNRLRGGCSYTSGANTYFQGLTADGAKAALWAITKEQYANVASPLWGTRIVNFVHDENLIEGPEETVDVWAREAARIMIEQMSRYTPRVRVSVDVSVMRRWYKGAKPTFNSAGQYVPWEPK